jgi:hypothetical protein
LKKGETITIPDVIAEAKKHIADMQAEFRRRALATVQETAESLQPRSPSNRIE